MTSTNGQRVRLLLLPALLILSISLLASACSGDDGGGDGTTPSSGETPTDGGDGAASVTFDISMGDNFFEPNVFTASPGQQVTFTLTNDGLNIHNLRIAGSDNEYNNDDDAVSQPEAFQAGDAGTVVWTAPDQPGTYDFRCDFHPIESTGTITVQ